MISEALSVISEELKKLNINYQFGRWQGKVVYPYFVKPAQMNLFLKTIIRKALVLLTALQGVHGLT